MKHLKAYKILGILFLSLCYSLGFFSCSITEENTDDSTLLTFEVNKATNSFFMENENELLIINAVKDNSFKDEEVSWTLFTNNIDGTKIDKSDCITHISTEKIIIKMQDLAFLGDYELIAHCKNISKTYQFSLNSTKEIENALFYSFVPIENLKEEKEKEFLEYSILGKRLLSANERSILGKSLSYSPSSTSLLFITGDTSRLGELTTKENNDFYISKLDNKGIYLEPKNKDLNNSNLSIYAGTKKKKDVEINLLKTSLQNIKPPVISKERAHKKSGVIVSITADNVSTDYYKFDDGYSLDITIKRCINDERETLLTLVPTKTQSEWKTSENTYYITPIEYGYDVYLPFFGKYTIDAKTVAITGESETTSYSFNIDYKETKNNITKEIIPYIKNDLWLSESIDELNKNGFYTPLLKKKVKIKIPERSSGEFLLFASYDSDNQNYESYTKKREVLENGSTLSFKTSGNYSLYITEENVGDKLGNLKDEEYKEEDGVFSSSFTLNSASEGKSITIIGNSSLINGYYNFEYRLKDDNDIAKNYTIYSRLLIRKNSQFEKLDKNNGSFYKEQDTILEDNKTYTASIKFNEIKSVDDVKLALYILPKDPLTLIPPIRLFPEVYNSKIVYSDAVPSISILAYDDQDLYNTKRIKVSNVKDESGVYKKLYYSFDTNSDYNSKKWTYLTSGESAVLCVPSKINPSIFIKAVNYNESHTVYKDQIITLEKLSRICSGEIFGTYGTHGAPYKNEMFKIEISSDKEIVYIFQCFRKDGSKLECLYLYYDKSLQKWRVHQIKDNGNNEFYDANIENGWWIAKNYHQLFIYKTDQYCGVYKAKKGFLSSDISYSYPIFEGNEDSNKYCSVYKYLNILDKATITSSYTNLFKIEYLKELVK